MTAASYGGVTVLAVRGGAWRPATPGLGTEKAAELSLGGRVAEEDGRQD